MTLKRIIQELRDDPKNAIHFIVGYLVIFLHDRKYLNWLLPFHVRFWVEYRKIRAEECYNNGECVCCGCTTPELFGATKGCKAYKYRGMGFCEADKKVCYPPLMNRKRTLKFLKRIIRNGSL